MLIYPTAKMNKKELEKIKERFFTKINRGLFRYPCKTCGERSCEKSHEDIDPSEVLKWLEEEIKAAYHKGYMEGTMEAL